MAKSNAREFDAVVSAMPEAGICRPFNSTRLKSGPTPRTVTLRAFTDRTVDRDAADALQGFGEIGVRELADVLGDDAVHHALRLALQFHRDVEAAADAGDDDLF